MSRGRHSRNYVWFHRWSDWDHAEEVEVLHEEKNTARYGWFGVVEDYWNNSYFVIWRANRNASRPWSLSIMGPGVYDPQPYLTLEEAIESIRHWMFNWETPPKKQRSLRDAQKGRVYKWERAMVEEISPTSIRSGTWPNGTKYETVFKTLTRGRTETYLREMLERMCSELSEAAPVLKFRSGGRSSYGGSWRIRLLPNHCREWVLIHELAHTLHHRHRGDNEQGHGKEFVGWYCYLLIRFGHVDEDRLVDTMHQHRVKYQLPSQYFEWRRSQDLQEAA